MHKICNFYIYNARHSIFYIVAYIMSLANRVRTCLHITNHIEFGFKTPITTIFKIFKNHVFLNVHCN